jgi:hypothetical protein
VIGVCKLRKVNVGSLVGMGLLRQIKKKAQPV